MLENITFPETTKLAVIGTSCIGKTTVVDEYRRRQGVLGIDEAARAFFIQNPHVGDRFSADTQGRVQLMALGNELQGHANRPRWMVCDRAVVDAAGYTYAHGDRAGAFALLDRVSSWMRTYGHIILLEPDDIPYEQDDVRTEPLDVRNGIHEAFVDFMHVAGID